MGIPEREEAMIQDRMKLRKIIQEFKDRKDKSVLYKDWIQNKVNNAAYWEDCCQENYDNFKDCGNKPKVRMFKTELQTAYEDLTIVKRLRDEWDGESTINLNN